MHSNHRYARARLGAIVGAVSALAAGTVLLVAAPAAAHVHVDGDAVPGERATVSFRVPTESDTAATTSLTITLPTDTPITSVRPQSKPGWEIEVTRIELAPPVVNGDVTISSAVGSVTWTATDGGIAPGEFDDFVVQLGPIPDVPELVIPTLQGYSDGTSVDWSEVADAGAEPEHPAPVLAIGADAGEEHVHDGSVASPQATVASEAPASDEVTAGLDGFAIAGFVVGAAGLVAAIVAIVIATAAERRIRRG